MARSTHEHAKAGNINHALKMATGDLVAIFDCDHLPTRSFLQMTVGWFYRDPRLGVVQTPTTSSPPIRSNTTCNGFARCRTRGSLLRPGPGWQRHVGRQLLLRFLRRHQAHRPDEIGGIAVETVTEDAHTSLGCTASATPRPISGSRWRRGWPPKASLPTSVSASGGRAAWCRSCVWTTPLRQGLQAGAAAVLLQCHAAFPLGHTEAHLPDGAARLP